ncbi:MAG: peptidylprolyl isomerase [Pseudomonadales bacterium]|nr:peptidylprolyl isomerase [Pseudomonadales bacterium]
MGPMPRFYKFDYALKNPEGEVVDSSAGGEAMSFVEGDGTMIPGLEKALLGREQGDEFQVVIQPDEAYGWPQRSLIRTLSTDMFEADVDEIEEGMIFQVGSGEERQVVKVIEVDKDGITVDGNHPLAGITFRFDITVLEAREATAEEIASSRQSS